MSSAITHILPSSNEDMEKILLAAYGNTGLDWTCPKRAKPGDRVFFHVGGEGLVAFGSVDSQPEPAIHWNRRYAAQIVNVHLLATFVSLVSIQEEMPGFGWARYPRSYVTLSAEDSEQIDAIIAESDALYSDVEADGDGYIEGSVKSVYVNAYERSAAARKAAIEEHKPICSVCGCDFGKLYGPTMAGFIHIHHIRPLNEIEEAYRVNPKKDLIPVCPNCHAVIHSQRKALTVAQVRSMYKGRIGS
jgi:hypothetical protein